MIVRNPKPEEKNEILNILDGCFGKTPRAYFEHYVEDGFPESAFVVLEGSEILGYLQVYTRLVRSTAKKPLKMGGIGNVCTVRKARGRGIASSLLQHAYSWMESNGYDLSVLFASRHGFYTKNGWKLVPVYLYEFDVKGKNRSKEYESPWKIMDEIMEVSASFNSDYALTVIRDERIWRFQLDYYNKIGSIFRAIRTERLNYAIFKKVGKGRYILSDFAGDVSVISELLPEDIEKLIFFSKPYHELTEFLRDSFPHSEREHLLIYIRGVGISNRELDDLIFTRKWHFWEFDMF